MTERFFENYICSLVMVRKYKAHLGPISIIFLSCMFSPPSPFGPPLIEASLLGSFKAQLVDNDTRTFSFLHFLIHAFKFGEWRIQCGSCMANFARLVPHLIWYGNILWERKKKKLAVTLEYEIMLPSYKIIY